MRWAVALMIPALLVGFQLARTAAAGEVPEQKVTPLTPQAEQRVEAVTPGGAQRVEPLDAPGVQDVTAHTPPGAARKAASTTGKAVLAVVAVGVSLGFTVASLLFI